MNAKTTMSEQPSRGRQFLHRWQSGLPRIIVYALLTLVAIVSLFPLYWLFNTAFTPATSTVKLPPDIIPVNATINNFVEITQRTGLSKVYLPGQT